MTLGFVELTGKIQRKVKTRQRITGACDEQLFISVR